MANFDNIKDKGLLSSRGMDLLRTRQERMKTKSVQEVRVIEKIAQDQKEIEKIMQNVGNNFEANLDDLGRLSSRIEEYKKLLSQLEKGRTFSADKQFKSGMRTAMSSRALHEDIGQVSRSPNTFSSALEIAKNMTTAEIQSELERNKQLASRQSSRISETAQDVKGNEAKLETQLRTREKAIQQAGMYQSALGTQKKLGLDMESRYFNAYDVTQKAIKERAREDISKGVAENRFGDRSQVEEKLSQATERLISTFEKFNSIVDKSSKEAAELANEFDKAQKEVDQHKMVRDEMNRSGGGGGGGGGLQTGMSMMGNLGTLGVTGANMYRYIQITSELQKMQNSVGFAQVQNTRFQDQYDAGRGNMSAFRRVTTDQAGLEAAFGTEMGEREGIAAGVQAVGRGGQAAGALKDSVDPAKDIVRTVKRLWGGATEGGALSAGANMLLGAAADASPAIGAAGQDITAYLKKIPQEQTALQSQSLYRQLQDTINQIGDASMQQARDVLLDTTMATRGMGAGRREGVVSALTDPQNRQRLAKDTGMSNEEIASATRTGVSALGSQFKGIADIRSAGQLSRAGYFEDPNQMLQARGMLSNVGGGSQKDLETIMKNAVANGMDSSKNIMDMVSGVTALSENGASLGIDMVSGVTEMLGRSIDSLRGAGVDKNMATTAAQRGMGVIDATASDSSLSLHNVVEMARIGQEFGDLSYREKQRVSRMTPTEIAQLQAAKAESPEAYEELGIKLGIPKSIMDEKGALDKVRDITAQQTIFSRTGGIGQGNNAEGVDRTKAIYDKVTKFGYESLDAEDRRFYNMSAGNSADAELPLLGPGAANKENLATGPVGARTTSGELDKTATAISDARMFSDGARRIEKAAGGFDNLGKKLELLASKLDPATMAEATRNAAEEHGFSKGQFDATIKPFTTAVDTVADGLLKLSSVIEKINNKFGDKLPPGASDLLKNINPRQGRK